MDNKLRVERIKQAMGIKTNIGLARKLGVEEKQIYRWINNGFRKSTEKIIDFLLIKT
jgi:hypothetical protein